MRPDLVFKAVCLISVNKLAVTVQSNHLSICQAPEKFFSEITDVQEERLGADILQREKQHVFRELLVVSWVLFLWGKL